MGEANHLVINLGEQAKRHPSRTKKFGRQLRYRGLRPMRHATQLRLLTNEAENQRRILLGTSRILMTGIDSNSAMPPNDQVKLPRLPLPTEPEMLLEVLTAVSKKSPEAGSA